jgi:hypothetical protein
MHYKNWNSREDRYLDLRGVDAIVAAVASTVAQYHPAAAADNARLHADYLALATLTLIKRALPEASQAEREEVLATLLTSMKGMARAALFEFPVAP